MPAYITITARLARDPEVRETHSGTTICSLTLPNDSGWGDHKVTTWWNCTIFGKRGETAAQYLRKGSWVTVTGEPSLRKYETKAGKHGASLEVRVSDWGFCGPKPEAQQQSSSNRGGFGGGYNADAPSPDLPF